MNMVVEGLALGGLPQHAPPTTCPLLRALIEGVLRDESRHVAFGNVYVARRSPRCTPTSARTSRSSRSTR